MSDWKISINQGPPPQKWVQQEEENRMRAIGDNKPPSQIDFAGETADLLGEWLKENPVIESEEAERDAKLHLDRGRLCLQDAEDEKKAKTAPLYKEIAAIHDAYRGPVDFLKKLLTELKGRMDARIKVKEEIKQKALAEVRKKEEEARQRAIEAERRESEAKSDAAMGVETDVAATTRDADSSFKDFQHFERERARIENAYVGIRGGHRAAYSTREQKELVIGDPMKALAIMGWSERLLEALGTDARLYKRKHGRFPDGVSERRL